MSCQHTIDELPLYVYGELDGEEEEKVEQHLSVCTSCSNELGRVRAFGRAMDSVEMPVPEDLLAECRRELDRQIRVERIGTQAPRPGLLARLQEYMLHDFMGMHINLRVPAGALALIAVGFLIGKVAPGTLPFLGSFSGAPTQQAGFVNVRSVESDSSGKVRVTFDKVSQASVAGSADDPKIRALLLSSMKDQSNPGLRVEAVGVIKDHAEDAEIRNALLDAVQHDPNVGVRMNAVEGLRQFGGDPAVRKAMTAVLLNDVNPGVRVKAIDLLAAHKDQSIVGPLQNAMQREDNSYVRMRMRNALREMNASLGTF